MAIEVPFKLIVKCAGCGEDLSDAAEAEKLTQYGEATIIRVTPCAKCGEQEHVEGYEQGLKDAERAKMRDA